MVESVDWLHFGGGHIGGVLMDQPHFGQGHLRYVHVFSLGAFGGVRGMEASIFDFGLGLFPEREPLKSERGPFKFLDEEAVIEKAGVFQPDVGVGLRFLFIFLHGANQILL